MKLLPQTLLGRTALLIALILVLSQVSSTLLFRFYYHNFRAQQAASLIVSNINSIEAALKVLPLDAQQDFLQHISLNQDTRILPGTSVPSMQEPNTPFLRALYSRLKDQYGKVPRLSLTDRDGPVLWVRLPAVRQDYWIGMSLKNIDRGFPWPYIGWFFVGGVLSLLGAFLVVRRINRPLHQLANAAADIGRGKTPPLLAETGPLELRMVSHAFNQMAQDVEQLNKDRNLLLAGVSHDLRTPLSRVRLAVEMLEKDTDPELRQSMIQDIEDMDAIVSQFLGYVREGSDEATGHGDLNRLIREVSERFSRRGKNISLHLQTLPAAAFKPLAMQRLLSNLLDNALRHGGPDVEIHTRCVTGCIIVKVADSGPGIPESERQRLMQPFTRLNPARGQAGAGLGLAIVDKIAKLHGGKISLLTRAGGGLEVRLELPLNSDQIINSSTSN
ncbi:MAG TPA: ATP-binding protein [Acidiferrobacterales bacterium]|nr:ATP-binding protein [Acidiferrobacterales bacterium]